MTRPDELCLLPRAASAIRRLNDLGLRAIVVTNQRGIALGRMTVDDLRRVHARLDELLYEDAGASVDAYYYCPHDVGQCDCRKPGTAMFLAALQRWPDIELKRSAMIGDSESDIQAGRALEMQTVMLPGQARDLLAAIDRLLEDRSAAE